MAPAEPRAAQQPGNQGRHGNGRGREQGGGAQDEGGRGWRR
jgi:hypothetical protein